MLKRKAYLMVCNLALYPNLVDVFNYFSTGNVCNITITLIEKVSYLQIHYKYNLNVELMVAVQIIRYFM